MENLLGMFKPENLRICLCNKANVREGVITREFEWSNDILEHLRFVDGDKTVIVNESLLNNLSMTEEEMWTKAKENSERNSISFLFFGEMLVISNKEKTLGAYVNENIINRIKNKYEMGNVYVLPSSVHEVIIVEKDRISYENAENMVKDVNKTLEKNEFLSDYPFIM